MKIFFLFRIFLLNLKKNERGDIYSCRERTESINGVFDQKKMLTAEERRQRILANSEKRLAKLRDVERNVEALDFAPVSAPAPEELLVKPPEEPVLRTTSSNSSILSSLTSVTSMFNSLKSAAQGKQTATPEITREILMVDRQHLLVFLLGVFVGLLYAFYLSAHSNLFFVVFFTALICLLTSRYYFMKIKHRTNVFLSTAMLSGFRPDLMKQLIFVYTLICDSWIIFSFYFVAFCLTHVFSSLFRT